MTKIGDRVDFCEPYRQTLNSPVRRIGASTMAGCHHRSEAKADSGTVRSYWATMSADRVSYTLDSTLETVNNAEETAGRIAAEAGFDDEEIMKISMAVREAAVNAVLHGNAYDPTKKVTLAFERTAHDLVIVIRDQGKGLDASRIPDPLAPDNLLKTSGRGIFLIRSFMDVVEIHPSQTGTELRMIKHVHGNPADSKEAPQ
jgi:serine/threonine-protein kinase RsbW